MTKFVNRDFKKTQPDFFYSVSACIITFGKDKPYSDEKIFKGKDLLKCRAEATKYYDKKLEDLRKSKSFLPFASPQNFVKGKNSAPSVTLSLIEHYTDDNSIEHPLMGGDDGDMAQSMEIEAAVLKEKGYLVN